MSPAGGLTPTLEALAARLTRAASRDWPPASPAPSRAEPPASGGDPVAVDLDLTKILAMSLDRFAREGPLLEVRVPWHGETVWFVPDDRQAEALVREGVSRGRIWTARELSALMVLPDPTPEIVQRIALAKREFDGDIVQVRPRGA